VIPTHWFLILSAILFTIGVCGVLTRRNGITIFMSIELMVNAVNLTFLAYAHQFGQTHGLIFVFFIMAIAAAEAAIGPGHLHLPVPSQGHHRCGRGESDALVRGSF